jgi:hypothetical protein
LRGRVALGISYEMLPVSEPYFPSPTKRVSEPYREAAVVAAPAAERWPELREKAREVEAPKKVIEVAPEKGSLLADIAWRFAAKAVALGVTVGVLWALVRAHELGAKWPQGVMIALGVVGILAAPVVLYFRLRRLVRFLFARDDDA